MDESEQHVLGTERSCLTVKTEKGVPFLDFESNLKLVTHPDMSESDDPHIYERYINCLLLTNRFIFYSHVC